MLDLAPKKSDLDPIEIASRDEIAALQLKRLKETLRVAFENVPHYRAKCLAAGVAPEDCRSLGDLGKFPFTMKADLRETYPFGMLAVPHERIARVMRRPARLESRPSSPIRSATLTSGRTSWRARSAPPAAGPA